MTFTIATTVDEALGRLADGARPVAGGTDLVVGARQGKAPLPRDLVAIDRIDELLTIGQGENGLRIGAGVTHDRLMSNPLIVRDHTALADGAALIGSPATRHVGTIGGNVMNGSPAMDTGAPLVVLGARIELRSATTTRLVDPLELWTGPGSTSARADELCTACLLPALPTRTGSAYVRLEYRRAMEIAVVGAAALVSLDESGSVLDLRIALTAVAPTIMAVERTGVLKGRTVDDALTDQVAALASAQASPISDLRAGDRYRRHTVGVMARRAVQAAAQRARGTMIDVPVNRAIGIGAAR